MEALANIKSKEELIAELVALLQSPIMNVMSQLQTSANNIHGVLQTLSEKE
jgi:large subunit ribosomal protein L10